MATRIHMAHECTMQAIANDYTLPAVQVFTDYCQWERRPSSKSGASGVGWSVSKDRGTTKRKQYSHHCRHDTLSLAARLSQNGVLVDRIPTHFHTHSHSNRINFSDHNPPKLLNTSSPDRKISKARSVATSVKYSLLKIQLETRRKSIEVLTKYKEDLLAANLKMIGIIRKEEDEKFSSRSASEERSDSEATVQELLEKYRKSRGSVAALKKKTHRDKLELEAELEKTKQLVHKKEEDLLEEVREAEMLLQARVKERDVLKSFKEKEYMVNQVTIDHLRDEIKQHAQHCEENISTVDAQIAEEREKCQRMMDGIRKEIEARATEDCISKMKRSVKEKGIQNRIMKKEIHLHCEKADTMRESIRDLKEKIEQLKLTLHEDNVRMRPLMAVEKCLPDTELHLNIPVLEFPPL